MRLAISSASIMDDSSTTRRSAPSLSSAAQGSSKSVCSSGRSSRRWCSVDASIPICSLIRRAARPVGAARAISASGYSLMNDSTSTCKLEVLPVPGPPVITDTGEESAIIAASLCVSSSLKPRESSVSLTIFSHSSLFFLGLPFLSIDRRARAAVHSHV